MGATKILLTAGEFDNYALAEDKRYEPDEGELIEMTRPAYKRNRVMQILVVELELYFRARPIVEALLAENLYALWPDTRRSPDVAVILGNRRAELRNAKVIPIVPGPTLPEVTLGEGDTLASPLLPGFSLGALRLI